LWVIFALLGPDPDPDSEYGSGSGSTGPIEYGSNPDPKPWLPVLFWVVKKRKDVEMKALKELSG
jgi:hypothetical protein